MAPTAGNVSLIGAMGKDRGLGFSNELSWRLPDDLKRFKGITRGHAVIMGRKTYESIGGPLPERKNIVITRNAGYRAPGCTVVGSMEEAMKVARTGSSESGAEVFVIGGAEAYKLGLPYADKMYLTFVDADVPADAFFPEFDEKEWRVVKEEKHERDEKHAHSFVFKVYERE